MEIRELAAYLRCGRLGLRLRSVTTLTRSSRSWWQTTRATNQDIEEDSVEDSSAGQIDSVDAEAPSEVREVIESAVGPGSVGEPATEGAFEPEAKRARIDEQD